MFRLGDGFPAVSRQPLTPSFGAVPLGQKPNTSIGFFSPDQVSPVSYQDYGSQGGYYWYPGYGGQPYQGWYVPANYYQWQGQ